MTLEAPPQEAPPIPVQPGDDRRSILDAVVCLASGSTAETLTGAEIAARAGVSSEAFAEHFASVEDAVASAVEDALERMWEAAEGRMRHADDAWADQVAALVVGFLGFVVREPEAAWLAIAEPLADSVRASAARTRARLRLSMAVAAGPERGWERGATGQTVDAVRQLWELGRQRLTGTDPGVDVDALAQTAIFLILSPRVDRATALRHARSAPPIVSD